MGVPRTSRGSGVPHFANAHSYAHFVRFGTPAAVLHALTHLLSAEIPLQKNAESVLYCPKHTTLPKTARRVRVIMTFGEIRESEQALF